MSVLGSRHTLVLRGGVLAFLPTLLPDPYRALPRPLSGGDVTVPDDVSELLELSRIGDAGVIVTIKGSTGEFCGTCPGKGGETRG